MQNHVLYTASGIFCTFLAATSVTAYSAPIGTIGLAVVALRTAGVETPYLDECPEGVAIGNDEIWWKSLSPRDRDRLTEGGEKEPSARRLMATLRGPQGEDVCWNPASVTDPPLRIVKGNRSVGLNLDGTLSGEKTSKTCAHLKFTDADGVTGIDNQMRRVVGCIHGWRANGYIEMVSDTERRNSSQGVILIQITGVKTLADSPSVSVRFFRADNAMPKDAGGNILPFASYRIDGNPRYGMAVKGRIKDSVLTTEPADVRLPFYGNRVETEFLIKDLQLKISLSDQGATGLIAGYHDLDNWWDYVRKMGYLVETAQFSCPALYVAAHQLADGYPDPQTGNCTALSVAYNMEAVRAFVIETPKPMTSVLSLHSVAIDTARLPTGIKVGKIIGGEVLTTADGKTLYTQTGASCRTGCGADLISLNAPWGALAQDQWSIERTDSQTGQWTYAGHLVFTCARDNRPGDIRCADQDWLAMVTNSPPAPPSTFKVYPSEVGAVLAERNGRTLYRFIGSMTHFMREICARDCMDAQWRLAVADGEPTLPTARPFKMSNMEGQRVWTFQNSPLYTFAGDTGPGQIAGHRFGGASVSAKNWFSALTLKDALETQQSPEQVE